jgi:protein-tyrosine phosphatase
MPCALLTVASVLFESPKWTDMKTLLFLCTGNYYRSRFAEEFFNFCAPRDCLGWTAISRGIAVDRGHNNVGPIAGATAKALQQRGVNFERDQARYPLQLQLPDLEAADHIVALKFAEHFPLMGERFPAFAESEDSSRIEYWRIDDVDAMTSDEALPLIEEEVYGLMRRLKATGRRLLA